MGKPAPHTRIPDTPAGPAHAEGSLACEKEMTRAAALNRVPLNVLYSVGLTETGRTGELSPYDMNIDGKAIHSASAAEAMTRFNQAKARGAKLIDVGCMQINHHWHSADFASLSEMFNPVRLDDPPLPAERPRVRGPAAKSGRDHVADDRADVSALHRRIVWPGVVARDKLTRLDFGPRDQFRTPSTPPTFDER